MQLDKKTPGWMLAHVHKLIVEELKGNLGEDYNPNYIRGDFDDDGHLDHAVYVTHPHPTASGFKENSVIILFSRGEDYEEYIIPHGSGSTPWSFIVLRKKGTKGFDIDSQKEFIFDRDAYSFIHYEKSAVIYIYKNGDIKEVYASD